MPGLVIITLIALLSSPETFTRGSSQRVIPLRLPLAPLLPSEAQAQSRLIQELVRTKRHSARELVRAQPHLVHDMGWPEIHETSRSQTKVESANSSALNYPPSVNQDVVRTHAAVDESLDVEDVMEQMIHLAVPLDAENNRRHLDPTESGGPGAGDTSQEASGFDGMDTEDRERGEEGEEDQDRRGGEEERERFVEDRERREGDVTEEEDEKEQGTDEHSVSEALEVNHTTPDLDALIGYTSSFHPSKEPSRPFLTETHDYRHQELRGPPVLEMSPLEKDLRTAEKDEDIQSSGYGVLRSSVTAAQTSTPSAAPADRAVSAATDGTATPETGTGTDFGLLGSYTKDETEEEETGLSQAGIITQNPTAPEVGLAPSREPLQPSLEQEEHWEEDEHDLKDKGEEMENEKMEKEGTSFRGIIPLTTDPSPTTGFTKTEFDPNQEDPRQVVCLNWSELAGRGYVILNMTKNMNCEEFRVCQGVQLLKIIEREFARRMNSPEGSWVLYLSKPTHQQHQLLMNVASGHGVIATQEVLDMLGEIGKNLNKVGIQNYSAATSCQSRPSKTRSDYEELHSVENGYHDNPTLDVTNDSQAEMREKKPSTNGLTGAGGGGGAGGGAEDSSRWQAFVNQAVTEDDEEEQDTHL
ncbi:podocalyxin-like protein 2 isoform X2 [Girardinichthys multiradiatus]|uniref:podocalyxin-like protein 2 isoform X2 n=1 Tax=Girardinichthys multiradiatus TaxID=208333 RepID=UPI001FAC14D2|nr:podocalyxin-like protein 2 isoform X2 [Girardinichthys multiradiatus]